MTAKEQNSCSIEQLINREQVQYNEYIYNKAAVLVIPSMRAVTLENS